MSMDNSIPSLRPTQTYEMDYGNYIQKVYQQYRDAARQLELPQLTVATAIVFFQRFYQVHSFQDYDYNLVSMGCLLLSGKTSETPRKLRKILAIYLKFLGEENHSESLIFHQYEKKLVCMERVIMYTLGFSFKVEHPYKHLIEIHRSLSAYIPKEKIRQVLQYGWNFVNDSYRTKLCLQHIPRDIAAAAFYMALKALRVAMPDLYKKMETSKETVSEISNTINQLYQTRRQETAKLKAQKQENSSSQKNQGRLPVLLENNR